MYKKALAKVNVALLVHVDSELAERRIEELKALFKDCGEMGVGVIYLLPNTGFAEPLKKYESAVTTIEYGAEPSYSADITQILSCKSRLVQNGIEKIAILGAEDKLQTTEKLMNGPICQEPKYPNYYVDDDVDDGEYQGGNSEDEDDPDDELSDDDLQDLEWISKGYFGADQKIDTVVLDKQPLSLRLD